MASSQSFDKFRVLILYHQLTELGLVRELHAEEPALAFRIGVDFGGIRLDRFIGLDHLARNRRVNLACGLYAFHDGGFRARRDFLPRLRQFDIDYVAQLLRGVFGDSDRRYPIFDPQPFVAFAVAQFGHCSLLTGCVCGDAARTAAAPRAPACQRPAPSLQVRSRRRRTRSRRSPSQSVRRYLGRRSRWSRVQYSDPYPRRCPPLRAPAPCREALIPRAFGRCPRKARPSGARQPENRAPSCDACRSTRRAPRQSATSFHRCRGHIGKTPLLNAANRSRPGRWEGPRVRQEELGRRALLDRHQWKSRNRPLRYDRSA